MKYSKQDVLIACALAYFQRGNQVQYDQYSMDRVLRITPRRRITLPPEAATNQYTLYLDCSGFVQAAYYEALGYVLPAKLTWHIIDYVQPRTYYYELTHEETPDQLKKIENDIRQVLEPGDLVTYELGQGNGHVMMILNEREYIHCSQHGEMRSYDYTNRRNRHREGGSMWIDPIDTLFGLQMDGQTVNFLFDKRVKRFSVCRPLETAGAPTPNGLARLSCKNLRCAVECSHPGAQQAALGDLVEYRVVIDNLGDQTEPVDIIFEAPAGATRLKQDHVPKQVPAAGKITAGFFVRVDRTDGLWLEGPEVTVNQMRIFTHPVLLRPHRVNLQIDRLTNDVITALSKGSNMEEAIIRAYREQNIVLSNSLNCAFTHFLPVDSVQGDVLVRCTQHPQKDLAVYSLFGGYGVITPEMNEGHGVRTTLLTRNDLEAGDILWFSDDSFGNRSCLCLYTGEGLIGTWESDEIPHLMETEETDQLLDSLFGRYVFLVLRPKQASWN